MKRLICALLAATALGTTTHAQTSGLNTAASQATATAAASWVITGAHALLGFTVAAPTPLAAPAFVLVFDSASVPADGVVTPGACYPMTPAAFSGQWTSTSMANTPYPAPVTNGIVVVYSIGADCFHKTASAVAFMSVLYQ